MNIFQRISKGFIFLLSILSVSFTVNAANYKITAVAVTDIHSATFEGPIDNPTFNSAYDPNDFIPAINPAREEVSFVAVGTDNGGSIAEAGGYISFDGNTLLFGTLQLPDYNVVITSGGTTTVQTSGAEIILSPHTDNTANQFQYNGGSSVVADFSTFTDVVTACSGPACGAVPFLNLDGLKYEIVGEVTPEGGDTLLLRLQTDNDSVVEVQFVTELVPAMSSITVTDIHSATFEGPIDNPTFNSAYDPNDFIPAINPAREEVSFVAVGTDNGGSISSAEGFFSFDGNQLTFGKLLLPDYNVVITSGGTTTVQTSGAEIILTSHTDNTANQFQLDGGSNVVADFSTFSDVVTACSGPACGAVPFLNLDGLKYEIVGEVTPEGGDTLLLRMQTDNDSVLEVQIVTGVTSTTPEVTNVPYPGYVLVLLSALIGFIGYRKNIAK